MIFQDRIAPEDIHDISGHRKFIGEENAAFGNLWKLPYMENYSKTVTDLY